MNYYAVQIFNLDRKPVSCTEHRTLSGAWRAYNRAQNMVHPEGRGADKPWTGYVSATFQGQRIEMDRDPVTGAITKWEV